MSKPFELVGIDVTGPFPTTKRGNRYIIVAIDYFSKYVEAACVPDYTALTTAQFLLDNIVLRHGTPKSIISDQGPNFESKLVKELSKLLNINKLHSSPYHAMGNGMVERENRSLKSALRSYVQQDQANWDVWVPSVVFARNTTVHSTTGFSPYEVLYGHRETSVDDWGRGTTPNLGCQAWSEYVDLVQRIRQAIHKEVNRNAARAKAQQARQYSKKCSNPPAFAVGDLVLVQNHRTEPGDSRKLSPAYVGPLRVVEKLNDLNYRVRATNSNYEKVLHRNRLKKFHESQAADSAPRVAPPPATDLPPAPAARLPGAQVQPPTTVTRFGRASRPPSRLFYSRRP